jgi:ABC-2 type transport system ATP-binding protein
MNAIEIRDLTKKYSKFRLGPMSMTVPKGAIYGFIGPNGAGKTTTIDLMLGIGSNDSGQISVLGLDHRRDAKSMKARIGYVSPELNLAAWGKVGKAIRFIKGFYPDWDDDYCERLMKIFGLGSGEPIATLSFGSKIKLSLTLALSHRPEVLILDEPTVGLDAISKQALFAELLSFVEDGERAVLISSHGLADLERFADRIGIIHNGKMLVEGGTDEVVARFKMIDIAGGEPGLLRSTAGVKVLSTHGGKHRVLLDKAAFANSAWPPAMEPVSTSAMTLEEIFIALAKE